MIENDNQTIEVENQTIDTEVKTPKPKRSPRKSINQEQEEPKTPTRKPKAHITGKKKVKATDITDTEVEPTEYVESYEVQEKPEITPEVPEPPKLERQTVPLEVFIESLPQPEVPTTKPKKGHRPRKVDKEDVKEKTTCPDCNKVVSVHSLKYTHKRFCKNKPQEEATPEPVEVNESLEEKVKQKTRSLRTSTRSRPSYTEKNAEKLKQLVSLGLP